MHNIWLLKGFFDAVRKAKKGPTNRKSFYVPCNPFAHRSAKSPPAGSFILLLFLYLIQFVKNDIVEHLDISSPHTGGA